MKNDIKSILKDLYMIDPSLKDMEEDLKKLVQQLIDAKPDITIDKKFVKQLRQQLIAEMPADQPNWLAKFLFPFAGGVLATGLIAAVILAVSPNIQFNSKTANYAENDESVTMLSMTNQVHQLSNNAFGSLSELSSGDGATFDMQAATSAKAGVGAGGGIVTESVAPTTVMLDMEEAERTMIAPPDFRPVVYKYTYKGEPIQLPENMVDVYRRNADETDTARMISSLKNFDMGVVDLGSFKNLNVESIQLVEDRKEGYRINLNYTDNSISIYQNWLQWEQPDRNRELTRADIPADKKLISIADKFLKEHGINRENYGDPVINKYWYEMDIADYVPETVMINYPLLIEGKEVLDQGGNPTGLNVGVNLYYNKVTTLNNLRVENFESSAYEAVSDWQTVSDYLAVGATNYPQPKSENADVHEFEVGEPEIVLMSLWNPEGKGSGHDQYYLPALKFTVLPSPDSSIYPQKILVPLAKEMLKPVEIKTDEPQVIPLMEAREEG